MMSISIVFRIVLIITIIHLHSEAAEDFKIGSLNIHNNCFDDIFVHKVSHKSGSKGKYEFIRENFTIKGRKHSAVFNYQYETGITAGWDYWYIELEYAGELYQSKPTDTCNIGSSDEGGSTLLRVTIPINDGDAVFQVIPPKTSTCTFNLWRNGEDGTTAGKFARRTWKSAKIAVMDSVVPLKYGYFKIFNYGENVINVTEVSHHAHRLSDDSVNRETINTSITIQPYNYSGEYKYIFRTDYDDMRDFWYIRVQTHDGSTLDVNKLFWCNVTSELDTDKPVELQVKLINYTKEFWVIPTSKKSGACCTRFE